MTRLMVLGLLRTKPMSGYDLQQLLQISEADKWAEILPGSIYHALKKMDKEGLVKVAKVESTGHRSKAIYEVTDQGEEEYRKLLIESFRVSSVTLPVQLYTGLSMLNLPDHQTEPGFVVEAIEEQIQELMSKRAEMEAGQKTKAMFMEENELTKLTFENMLNQYKLQIDFLKSILDTLKK